MIKHHLTKKLTIWFFTGMMYFVIEALWRFPKDGGYANVLMLIVGGVCGVTVGGLNQYKWFYNKPVMVQAFVGAWIILFVEFVFGCIFNIWLQLDLWDYSTVPYNVLGQICLTYGVFWFLLAPFAIWVEDQLRYAFWREDKPYTLRSIYLELITLK